MKGLIAISGTGACPCAGVGQTAATGSKTAAWVAFGALALALGFAFLSDPTRRR